jgi:hypothetical protein
MVDAQTIHLHKDHQDLSSALFPSQKVSLISPGLICGVLYGILSTNTMHNSQIHNSITTLELPPELGLNLV